MSKVLGPHLAHLWWAYATRAAPFPDYQDVAQAVMAEPKFHNIAGIENADVSVLLYECVRLVQQKTVECWVHSIIADPLQQGPTSPPVSIQLGALAGQLMEKLPSNGETEGYPDTLDKARAAILQYMP